MHVRAAKLTPTVVVTLAAPILMSVSLVRDVSN
jgi:hypothetical protein